MPDQLPFSSGVTYSTVSTGNVANTIAVATLPAVAGRTNYVTGFMITSAGTTSASIVNPTVVGVVGGTILFTYVSVAGATLSNAPLVVTFPNPVPASGPNTAIQVVLPALGAGNTNASVTAFGFSV